MQFLYIISTVTELVLFALELFILARVILNLFPESDDWAVTDFIYAVTEPLLAPIRALLDKFQGSNASPFDFSSMVAILIIWVLQMILSLF